MNKSYFLPLVLTAAVASVASADTYTDQYTNVFTGVTSVSGLPAGLPTATGATWSKTGGDVALEASGGAVGFESEDSAVLKLTVASDPQDTNTIFKVAVSGTIEEVADLMDLAGANAQTALAICTNSFNAWNGSAWVALNEVPEGFDGSVPTNLLVEIKYQGTNTKRKVRFTVGNTTLSLRGTETYWIDLLTSANNLAGFGVNGSGTLAAVNGDVMLGVAEFEGVKYGTLTEAVAKAEEVHRENPTPIDVLRATDEDVEISGAGVVIADHGKMSGDVTVPEGQKVVVQATDAEIAASVPKGASGEYSFPVKVSGYGTVEVALPSAMLAHKEVVTGSITNHGTYVTALVQTSGAVLEGATPDGSKALTHDIAKLRGFLERNASTEYNAADVTSESIEDALKTPGANDIPLYQSYALGIEPTVSVKPVTKPGASTAEGITLYIPGLDGVKGSGDYTIKYKVDDTEQTGAGSITIPTTSSSTGSYPVKIVFQ